MMVSLLCPACRAANILIEPMSLMQGSGFNCPTCKAQIKMGEESVPVYQKCMQEFDVLAQKISR